MLVAGDLALSLAGFGMFAGVASADPDLVNQDTCWREIPLPSSTAWEVGNPEDAGCVPLSDTSDTSMADIDEIGTWGMTDIAGAGSYPGHNVAFTWSPQTVVP